ncbi:MAG: putative Ig domain-containing protein [Prolixibacteraceae bacterium]|jgi:alpha-galactosidase|nr:putative Ig domain-containing protein [Prolixibacteraceae bacterium]
MMKYLFILLAGLVSMSSVNCLNKGSRAETGRTEGCNDSIVNREYEIYTPAPKPQPRINGPLVYGCRPGHPFLYRIPCQGERPVRFSVKGLPPELNLDPSTGIITGTAPAKGEYDLLIRASNSKGRDERKLKIVAGDKLALTPPMGWNHWYAHYNRVTDKTIREAADVMIDMGMADVGYQYVNIDDCWMNSSQNSDSTRVGRLRDEDGNILPNSNFPDMKALTGYIHGKGLKAGLYTSPGPLTCGAYAGTYGHEEQDARRFAEWGFDFLKYDWCSYGHIALGGKPDDKDLKSCCLEAKTLEAHQYPYRLMGEILKRQNRDIVLNLCQYGWANVWEWGEEVGGHCWRTGGDLGFELDRIFDVALRNSKHREYSKPGAWNDPDYIQIGWIGSAASAGLPEPTKMPANMQYAYMSLWCLMASPLIYSGDMSKLDEFTLNVLCNPEVIDIDQDPLGECGLVMQQTDSLFLMVKNLYDGSKAVGLFNRGKNPSDMTVRWDQLQIEGKHVVRNLWRQKDIGVFNGEFSAEVPPQGVVMVKLSKR